MNKSEQCTKKSLFGAAMSAGKRTSGSCSTRVRGSQQNLWLLSFINGILLTHRNFPHRARRPAAGKAWTVPPSDRVLIFPRRELTQGHYFRRTNLTRRENGVILG